MEYNPHPIDLSNIVISEDIHNDMERIARNIHETWAQQRKNRGWGYGVSYDKTEKKHPCMVEYDDLPEIEKDMDRATVEQTIKMLLYMGYHIQKGE